MTSAGQKGSAAGTGTAAGDEATVDSLSLAVSSPNSMESHAAWPVIATLPVLLSVSIPLHGLRLRDLLALRAGTLLGSSWNSLTDLPVRVGALQLASAEFDVANNNIALRLTHLA